LRSFARWVDTEAVLQEALLRVWTIAPRVVADDKPEPLLRLAIRIARNLAVSELRRSRRRQPIEVDAIERAAAEAGDGPPGPDRSGDPILRRAIEECLRKLPAKPAAALRARLEGAGSVPDQTLAQRLGLRTNTFLQNLVRARRALAQCLSRRGVDLAAELS
jgi:RNA polymerase sigma factor (sigma-70 family)